MLQTLPPPVPAGLRAANIEERRPFLDSCQAGADERRPFLDQQPGTAKSARRRDSLQINVPLQVVGSSAPEVSTATVETLDLIARARQDLTAPLPPQMEASRSSRSSVPSQPGQFASTAIPHGQPGSLRCASQAPATDAAAASSGSASSPAEEAFKKERRQLREWGEGLFKQVGRLEQEKAKLEQAASAASAAKRQLEEELDRLKRWGADLERQVAASKSVTKENEDLRKQLAAYSVEVDALRDENEKIERYYREAQEGVQRMSDEREDLRNCIEELKPHEEGLRDLQARHEELLNQLKVEVRDRDVMKEEGVKALKLEQQLEESKKEIGRLKASVREQEKRMKSIQGLADVVTSWQDAYSKLQAAFVSQTREFGEFATRGKEQQRQAQEELKVLRQDTDRQVEFAEGLQKDLAEAQRKHAESCYWWQERVDHRACEAQAGAAEAADERVARERRFAEERLQEAQRGFGLERKKMEALLADETSLRRKLEEELDRREQPQRARNNKRQRRLSKDRALLRLERALERNIARDMFELHQGTVLEKVHDRNCRREPRVVVVLADEMQLRWSKHVNSGLGRSQSRLDLYEVIRIHYGSMARACVLHTDVPPWLCFSLHTPRRSYDFCCPDEESVQRFVLGISRLCDWASGTIATRRRFVALRGWCKLEDHCFREQISLGRLFIDALHRVGEAPGKIGAPDSPGPNPPAFLCDCLDPPPAA